MNKLLTQWLVAILIASACMTSFAEELAGKPKDVFIGKWDNHSGIISFFLKNSSGGKQLRMLAVDETGDTRVTLNLFRGDVDDLEELVEDALHEVRNLESLPIAPSNAQEILKKIGNLDSSEGIIKFISVVPAQTTGYIALRVIEKKSKSECAYWMDKDDLLSLKKLVDKALKEVHSS